MSDEIKEDMQFISFDEFIKEVKIKQKW